MKLLLTQGANGALLSLYPKYGNVKKTYSEIKILSILCPYKYIHPPPPFPKYSQKNPAQCYISESHIFIAFNHPEILFLISLIIKTPRFSPCLC